MTPVIAVANKQQWAAYFAYIAARGAGRTMQSTGRMGVRAGRGFWSTSMRWMFDGRVRRHRWFK